MTRLNPQQREAVTTIDRPLLVLAGAGSGKTRVITEKIAYLIRQGTPARAIAAVTFTNKAAREMKERVGRMLSANEHRGLKISTFHSLGLDILRKEHRHLGYKSTMTLFDEQDKAGLLRMLIEQETSSAVDADAVERCAQQIGRWKNDLITPQQAPQQTEQLDPDMPRRYQNYCQSLKAYNAVDFDDLIMMPVLLFRQQPEILEKWRNRIRYLLVDEYQDTNITQYHMVKLLTGPQGRLTVVGDDDQSIYAWRGAHPENLQQLQSDFPRLQVIKLEQNYRSAARILKAANHLIANNPHTFEKKLWSQLGYGDPLKVLSHKNEQAEAMQIVAEIVHHKFRHGNAYSDYAILYRGNHQSRLFERSLREQNVPYFISGSTSFFSYSEVKDVLAYLRLFVNPDDDTAFLRIVNTPRREIGPATLEKLGAYAQQREISLFSACEEFGLQSKLSEKALHHLQDFCRWVNLIAQKIVHEDAFTAIRMALNDIDYEQWLYDTAKTPTAAERKIKNVDDLLDWLQRLAEKEPGEPQSLTATINKLLLIDILERNQDQEAGDQVSLMTLHAAKGLEFPHVYLVGMEENLLPHQNSIEADQIEEERRLAYVGITRAQRSCTFSYCTHRSRYGETIECLPSRFLSELPAEDLEWPQQKQLPPEVAKERGKASLAQLKNLLS